MTLTELLFADDTAAVAIDKQRGHRERAALVLLTEWGLKLKVLKQSLCLLEHTVMKRMISNQCISEMNQ